MTSESKQTPFIKGILSDFESANLGDARLMFHSPESVHFGDTSAVFSVGTMLLKFIRERGQVFIELGTQAEPEEFYQFDYVAIAMGWRSLDEVLARSAPEPMGEILKKVGDYINLLQLAFSPDRIQYTRMVIAKASYDREQAFVARLNNQ